MVKKVWMVLFILELHSNEKSPKLDNIFLDCGAKDKEEVEKLGIHVETLVTYEDEFMIMNKNLLCR